MKNGNNGKAIDILLVEDNPGDVRLTVESLKEWKIQNVLHVVRDGEEAMDFLYRRGKYAEAIRPDLILLDLNLPKKSGKEVLKEIKEDNDLKRIPVAVLTISSAEEDILKAYDFHANCYILKPIGIDQFAKVVQSIEHFWFKIVTLPPDEKR